MKRISILLADDHKLMRMGLSALIAGEPDLVCVGEAANGLAAIEMARTLRPDVIVMDLMMPKLSGAEATGIIHREMPDVKIVILSSYGTAREMGAAIANGACGAILKDVETDKFVSIIRRVAAGKTVIPPHLMARTTPVGGLPILTPHQKQVLVALAAGRSNAEIARDFGISENTVKHLVSTILTKLGAATRTEAASIALREHLVETSEL